MGDPNPGPCSANVQARDSYRPEIILELQSNNVDEMEANVERYSEGSGSGVASGRKGRTVVQRAVLVGLETLVVRSVKVG